MTGLTERNGAAIDPAGLDNGAGPEPQAEAAVQPGGGGWRTQGLVDLQVNGYAGVDFNDPAIDADALDHALGAMLRSGVTGCLPTLITAPAEALAVRLAALDRAVAGSRLGPLMVPGFHLEGPVLNPADGFAGCHPADAMTAGAPERLAALCAIPARPVLLITLAPEQPGALDLARWAGDCGILVGMGHTAATIDDVAAAVAAGVRLSCHLGNGLPPTLAKFDNPLFAQLGEDRLAASFIADGVHMPPHALRSLIRAKGVARSILITDAVAPAAAPPGPYRFAGMTIEKTADGVVRQPGGRYLAGSALALDQAIRNLTAWSIATPRQAFRMACANPRHLLARSLDRFGLAWTPAAVTWSGALEVESVDLGDLTWTA